MTSPYTIKAGGIILKTPIAQAVFWGADWKALAPLEQRLAELVDLLISGPFMQPLAQYGVERGSAHEAPALLDQVPLPAPGKILDDDQLRQFLADQARSGRMGLAPVTDGRLYVVFLPPGQKITYIYDTLSALNGYHDADATAAPNVYYAVILLPSGTTKSIVERAALPLSQMLIDTCTDPLPGEGWLSEGYEVSDSNEVRHLGPLIVGRPYNKDGTLSPA